MKLWPLVLVAGMLVSHVTLADPLDKLAAVPEDVLQEGFTVATVCVATESAGIKALTQVIRAETAEPSHNSTEVRRKALASAEALLTSLQMYAKLGTAISEVLVRHYHHTEAEIDRAISEQLLTTRDDINAKLDNPIDYNDFAERFAPFQQHCSDATDTFVKKAGGLLKEPMESPIK